MIVKSYDDIQIINRDHTKLLDESVLTKGDMPKLKSVSLFCHPDYLVNEDFAKMLTENTSDASVIRVNFSGSSKGIDETNGFGNPYNQSNNILIRVDNEFEFYIQKTSGRGTSGNSRYGILAFPVIIDPLRPKADMLLRLSEYLGKANNDLTAPNFKTSRREGAEVFPGYLFPKSFISVYVETSRIEESFSNGGALLIAHVTKNFLGAGGTFPQRYEIAMQFSGYTTMIISFRKL